MLNEIIKKITEQQKAHKPTSAVFCVGEQLKDICANNKQAQELVLHDLDIKEMSIVECEKKIKSYADKHKEGNFAFVSPQIAHDIICDFYGIPKASQIEIKPQESRIADINLDDFFD